MSHLRLLPVAVHCYAKWLVFCALEVEGYNVIIVIIIFSKTKFIVLC